MGRIRRTVGADPRPYTGAGDDDPHADQGGRHLPGERWSDDEGENQHAEVHETGRSEYPGRQ